MRNWRTLFRRPPRPTTDSPQNPTPTDTTRVGLPTNDYDQEALASANVADLQQPPPRRGPIIGVGEMTTAMGPQQSPPQLPTSRGRETTDEVTLQQSPPRPLTVEAEQRTNNVNQQQSPCRLSPTVGAGETTGATQPQSSLQLPPIKGRGVPESIANGLELGLGLLKEAVTGIGVPGLEATVNGVVKVIEVIKNVRSTPKDIIHLNDRISGVAEAIQKSPNLRRRDEMNDQLKGKTENFLKELEAMLLKVQVVLSDRNLASKTVNSQANRDAITDVNARLDRLISRFSMEEVIGIGRGLDDVKETLTDQECEALIDKIPRVHARYYDTATKPSGPCFPGTRVDLLRDIDNWIDDPSGTLYLWLCGEVGVGKTTVAHTIAKERDGLGQLGASFFFSRYDSDRQSANMLFPSLAYQLARFDQGTRKALAKILKPDPDIVNRGPTDQLEHLILNTLNRGGINPEQTVVIIIDGLDECSNPDSVLDALATGIEGVNVRLRVLVCSRPNANILSKFKEPRLYHLASQQHFHDINDETLSSDVAVYLTWSLRVISRHPRLPDPWPTKDQLDELITRASGLFIIASTYKKYIEDKTEGNPDAQLKRILSRKRPKVGSSPLAELDALYDQVLDDLKGSLPAVPSSHKFAQDVVETVILAKGDMCLDALAGLLDADPSDVLSVLRRLTAVILLPDSQVEAIAPFHASFGEYIQDKERCTIQSLSFDAFSAHGRIADRCIAALVSATERGLVGVGNNLAAGISFHLRYASESLTAHIISSGDDRAGERRTTALGNSFWTWLDLMHGIDTPLQRIRGNVEGAGFKELLHVEGADAGTDISLAKLMIDNHILAINRTSDTLLTPVTPANETVAAGRSTEIQLVKFDISKGGGLLDNVTPVLHIVQDARLWNKHHYPDMFIRSVSADLNSLTEVQLFVSSSPSFREVCTLSKYLEKMGNLEAISRISLALEVAKAVQYLHETSPWHARGKLLPEFILVSAQGKPALGPAVWFYGEDSDVRVSFEFRLDRSDYESTASYWHGPEHVDYGLARARQFEDIWCFGCVMFQIMTTTEPLTRYVDLAKTRQGLGYDEDQGTLPDKFWSGDLGVAVYEERYTAAVSHLLGTIEGSKETKTVLKACWAFRPQERPSIRKLVQNLEAILQGLKDGL